MVSLRSMAFVSGAIGLLLFLAGIVWAFAAPSDPNCPDKPELTGLNCERHNYAQLLGRLSWIFGAGLLAEGAAVVLLMLHLTKKRPHASSKPMAGQPPPSDARSKNRFLEPPVPPRR